MNLLNSFSYELPTRIEYGVGVTGKLAEWVKGIIPADAVDSFSF